MDKKGIGPSESVSKDIINRGMFKKNKKKIMMKKKKKSLFEKKDK